MEVDLVEEEVRRRFKIDISWKTENDIDAGQRHEKLGIARFKTVGAEMILRKIHDFPSLGDCQIGLSHTQINDHRLPLCRLQGIGL